ncbi:hypothetical protein BN1708_014651 [Verticillium longisporum]|uniref:Secreted protein n=1 Tax=Verticillium longisporum TaxID=100787 RepID=A0A0G4LXA8_VERLO|nr:hypothetical protein BN1708_014651 [Verticillium longisporum]
MAKRNLVIWLSVLDMVAASIVRRKSGAVGEGGSMEAVKRFRQSTTAESPGNGATTPVALMKLRGP